MEFVSRVHEQTTERFRSLAPNTRLASIAAIVIILAGVFFLVSWRTDDVYEPLFDSRTFPLGEIAKMTAAFKEAGLNDSRIESKQILVPRADKPFYLVALKEADSLPADFSDPVTQAIADGSILSTARQNEMRIRNGELKKLEQTIAALEGIEAASVQYSEKKRGGFPATTEARAMVAVWATDSRRLENKQIETIRDMVAFNFAGLEREKVIVVDLRAEEAYPGDSSIGQGSALAATKRMLEREFRSKIEERLSIYPGAKAGVNVQLDAPDSPATPPTTTLVTASIDLPKSYFKAICLERHPRPENSRPDPTALANIEQEIKQNVERAVLAILPPPAPQFNVGSQVIVTSYEDKLAGSPDSSPANPTLLSIIATHWQLAAFLVAALFGLMLYLRQRQQLRGAHGENTTMNQPTTISAPGQQDSEGDRGDTNPNQRDELSQLIDQDPSAAAEVLTEWLRKKDAA